MFFAFLWVLLSISLSIPLSISLTITVIVSLRITLKIHLLPASEKHLKQTHHHTRKSNIETAESIVASAKRSPDEENAMSYTWFAAR